MKRLGDSNRGDLCPIDFANASPCLMAFSESSEPSVGIKMCLYMSFSFSVGRQCQFWRLYYYHPLMEAMSIACANLSDKK